MYRHGRGGLAHSLALSVTLYRDCALPDVDDLAIMHAAIDQCGGHYHIAETSPRSAKPFDLASGRVRVGICRALLVQFHAAANSERTCESFVIDHGLHGRSFGGLALDSLVAQRGFTFDATTLRPGRQDSNDNEFARPSNGKIPFRAFRGGRVQEL